MTGGTSPILHQPGCTCMQTGPLDLEAEVVYTCPVSELENTGCHLRMFVQVSRFTDVLMPCVRALEHKEGGGQELNA